ncbi:heterogeneous nuclear ribonucleoprotein M-like [Asterias rubens]|uniref:heterogeneous nuclear ribonucleoprotein M-like n=1 Tax=Asterias rubens TaxID=7604 RepID=UPI001455A689|nr:heterogeneous nuclear ribonucleoprotein M-like [Asterias rubens]
MEGYDSTEYEDNQPSAMEETCEDTGRNNTNGKKGSYENVPRMGLQGKRSRIRFQPYKGLGTRTYKNSVFVSNIAYELTEKQFKELFEDKVGKVSFCEIFPEPDGLSTGCGCVEFENEEDVEKSTIVLKKFQVQGRGLIVRDDRDLTFSSRYRPQAAYNQQQQYQQPPSSIVNPQVLHGLGIQNDEVSETIFIAKLADEVDLRKLKDVFSLAGLVMNCDILRDNEGLSIGLATVTFSSCEEAVNAVSMFDNQPLFDQKMAVRMNKIKKPQDSASRLPTELPQGLGSIGANLLAREGTAAGGDRPLNSLMGDGAMGGTLGVASMYGNRVPDYNRGGGHGFDRPYMPYGVSRIATNNRGYDMTPDTGYPADTRGGFGGGPMRGYDAHRESQQPSADGRTQVFVRNLSSDLTWEELKDSFKKVGPVYFAEIKKDSDGTSRCIGTVKFFNPLHAQQAILLLNGSVLKGRRIGVTMGRF